MALPLFPGRVESFYSDLWTPAHRPTRLLFRASRQQGDRVELWRFSASPNKLPTHQQRRRLLGLSPGTTCTTTKFLYGLQRLGMKICGRGGPSVGASERSARASASYPPAWPRDSSSALMVDAGQWGNDQRGGADRDARRDRAGRTLLL